MLDVELLAWHSPKDLDETNEPMGMEESVESNEVDLEDVGDSPTVTIKRDNNELCVKLDYNK